MDFIFLLQLLSQYVLLRWCLCDSPSVKPTALTGGINHLCFLTQLHDTHTSDVCVSSVLILIKNGSGLEPGDSHGDLVYYI